MRLNGMLEANQVRKNDKKDNLKIKICIILLLFVILIVVSVNIFNNNFDITNQSNVHVDNEIITEHNFQDRAEIEIQTLENKKRILIDAQINTWTVNDQRFPKVSNLSDGNFIVVWQSYLEDGVGFSIYGQIFYSNGVKKGNEFHASNSTSSNQTNPNVAGVSSDKFMVV